MNFTKMDKTKKLVAVASAVVIAVIVIFFTAQYITNNNYRSQLPELPDLTQLTAPVSEQLSEAHSTTVDNPATDNIGMLGMTYHSNAFYEQAEQCYQLAVKKDASKWLWSYYLGYLHQEMGDSKKAIENFSTVIKENPNALQVWYYLGQAYQNLGESEKAEEAFNKIAFANIAPSNTKSARVTYTPLPVSAKFELARIYLATKRIDEAEKLLKGVIEKNHTIGPVYRLLGNVYSAKGDSALSRKYTVRASDLAQVTTTNDTLIDRLALMSRSARYLPKQIEEALRSANPGWALQLFNHALKYIPDDKYLISKCIKYLLRVGKGEEALPFLEKNFNDFSDNYNEMMGVADQLYQFDFYAQAIPYYEQARKLQPDSYGMVGNLAMCYWRTGQKETALNLMNEVYKKNNTNPQVLADEIDFLFKAGQDEKAKSLLQKFRQVAPAHPRVLKLQGMVAETQGNPMAAIPLYEASLRSDPTDIDVISKLGNLLIDRREWSKAITLIRNSMKYHPNESILLERLGTLLISCPDPNLQNIPEGLELSERAFYHISSNMATLLSAGKNFALGNAMTGDYETASYYMNITLNIARSEKVPQDYLDVLLNLESEINKAKKN